MSTWYHKEGWRRRRVENVEIFLKIGLKFFQNPILSETTGNVEILLKCRKWTEMLNL
jgi:hypothetical protein